MPTIISGDNYPQTPEAILKRDFKYSYPRKLDLKPGSQLHQKLVTKILERARLSAAKMSNRHADWKAQDEKLTAYVRPEDVQRFAKDDIYEAKMSKRNRNAKLDDKNIEIVFPYSYTILETLLSYLYSVFIKDPIFMYEGRGSEDIIGAQLLEKVIAADCDKYKVGLNLHTHFRDSLVYGLGAVTPIWRETRGKIRTREQVKFAGIGIPGKYRSKIEDGILYEGNALDNIDPYFILPDVNVPISQIQDGEFFGWVEKSNLMDLLDAEKHDDDMFNVRYLRYSPADGTAIYRDNSGRNKKSRMTGENRTTAHHPVDEIHMYIKLIPKEWGLGKSDYPEKWYFVLANDLVITTCKPLGLDHDMFPVAIAAPDFDGYSISPIGKMEVLGGMQKTLDWLFNSHIKNVRKALNDMFIVDPYLVNIDDVNNPRAGKVIRLRRPAWGRGDAVKSAIAQFPVGDATRGHVADAGFVMSYMERIAGADSATQGALRQGGPERLTGAEFQGTRESQFNRLARIAGLIGMQSMQDIGYMFAMHTKQFMSQDTYIKLVGNLPEELMALEGTVDMGRFPVSPYDLMVNFDVKVQDGATPGSNYIDTWVRMFDIISKNESLAGRFDMYKIFSMIAKNAGAKNVEQFELRQMPDQNVGAQVAAGNLVPMGGF